MLDKSLYSHYQFASVMEKLAQTDQIKVDRECFDRFVEANPLKGYEWAMMLSFIADIIDERMAREHKNSLLWQCPCRKSEG